MFREELNRDDVAATIVIDEVIEELAKEEFKKRAN
jgi:hypothetical protein